MGTFPPESLCIELPDLASVPSRICLPGGVCLDYIWDSINTIPHLADMNMDFFSQIGPAMTPLAPFFNMLDVALSMFRCVQAVPDAITSLNPNELLQCMPALAKAVDQALKLIPQLSLPKMVKAIIENLASLLRGIATDLDYLRAQAQRIADEIDRAAEWNSHRINGFLVCAQETMDQTVLSTGEALKGIGSIVLLVNVFMGLFGGPEVPCFGDLISGNVAEGFEFLIDIILAMAELLETIAAAIPDPDLALTLVLGAQQC